MSSRAWRAFACPLRLFAVIAVGAALLFDACHARADESPALFFARPAEAHIANLPPPRHPVIDRRRLPLAATTRIGAPLDLHPLVAVARRYVGRGNFTGLRAAWCAAALRRWLAGSGYSAPRSNRAIDFARYGRPTTPHVGAIMVARGHVGIVVGMSARGPVILSGNWGRRVGIGTYAARRVIDYREPV